MYFMWCIFYFPICLNNPFFRKLCTSIGKPGSAATVSATADCRDCGFVEAETLAASQQRVFCAVPHGALRRASERTTFKFHDGYTRYKTRLEVSQALVGVKLRF